MAFCSSLNNPTGKSTANNGNGVPAEYVILFVCVLYLCSVSSSGIVNRGRIIDCLKLLSLFLLLVYYQLGGLR